MTLALPRQAEQQPAIEWPTLALLMLVYAGFFGLTAFHQSIPVWLLCPLAAIAVAWHSSCQHEILHGHPTRIRWLNTLLALPPLSLWVPYHSYRLSHLAHHRDERLTDPLDDPESFYWTPAEWAVLGRIGRTLVRAQTTLIGRLLIGPAWSLIRFWRSEFLAIRRGDRRKARIWAWHGIHVAALLYWVVSVCGMPLWLYLLAFVQGGTGLLMVRSFAEHRAAGEVERRTAVVENASLFGLLFLNNNLHVVHHAWPSLAWYRLPAVYRARRREVLAANGGLVYNGYREVFRRFFARHYDGPLHPLTRAPLRDGSPPSDPQAALTLAAQAGNG